MIRNYNREMINNISFTILLIVFRIFFLSLIHWGQGIEPCEVWEEQYQILDKPHCFVVPKRFPTVEQWVF